jgi:Late exocytosis, associated with Golgi transport/Cytosolic domain of 10TM putative phosphate transporter
MAVVVIIIMTTAMQASFVSAKQASSLPSQSHLQLRRQLEETSDDGSDDTSYSDSYYGSQSSSSYDSFFNNYTDPNFSAAKDVSVDAVVASLYFNALAFVCLMIFYELLRHVLPAVYSSKKRLDFVNSQQQQHQPSSPPPSSSSNGTPTLDATTTTTTTTSTTDPNHPTSTDDDVLNLPDERPLDWIRPVLGVPWNTVREMVGLDGYFFLRYIRMNVRITAISTFWIFLIVVPVYYFGGNNETSSTSGWYRISAANLSSKSNLMWIPCIVMYFFTGFIFFVIQQEYEHYFNIRQDFLAKGSTHVHPQHHYSVIVENIPDIYQSDVALAKYMESLFPDSVHSAVVVLNVPDLNDASSKCMRSCRRLEKSIAFWHATGKRPTHIVGRGRIRLLGIIDMAPLNCPTASHLIPHCNHDDSDSDDDDHEYPHLSSKSNTYTPMTDDESRPPTTTTTTPTTTTAPVLFERRPARGTRVDSISYYAQELAAHSRMLFRMQQRKIKIANDGAQQLHQEHMRRSEAQLLAHAAEDGTQHDHLGVVHPYWFDQMVVGATHVADQILDDSEWDNALITPPTYDDIYDPTTPKTTTSMDGTKSNVDYGSISPSNATKKTSTGNNKRARLMKRSEDDRNNTPLHVSKLGNDHTNPRLYYQEASEDSDYYHRYHLSSANTNSQQPEPSAVPFAKDQYRTWIRRWLGRLGLDFVVFVVRYITRQWEVTCFPVGRTGKKSSSSTSNNANIMSRTGFVTFLDLVSTTIAASAPLNSNRSNISGGPLDVTLAPEPRVRSLLFSCNLTKPYYFCLFLDFSI